MARPKIYKTEGVVLKGMPLGEADSLLTLFTPDMGKLRAVARGARRPTSKLAGHLEPITRSALVVARGQGLDVVTQAEAVETFPLVRQDLEKTSAAIYLAELVDAFTVEEAPNSPVYDLFLDALRTLGTLDSHGLLLRYFDLHLLGYAGFFPELNRCVACREVIHPGEHWFGAQAGGVVCRACSAAHPLATTISVDAMKVLRYLSRSNMDAVGQLRIDRRLARELRQVTGSCIRNVLEREVRSQGFLDLLRSMREDEEAAISPSGK